MQRGRVLISAIAPRQNLSALRELLKASLLRFIAADKSRGRLIFDLAVSSTVDVQQLLDGHDTTRVVKTFDNNTREHGWLTVIDLPSAEAGEGRPAFHGRLGELDGVRAVTGCLISVYGEPYFAGPLRLCSPYILLYGVTLDAVRAAYRRLRRILKPECSSDHH